MFRHQNAQSTVTVQHLDVCESSSVRTGSDTWQQKPLLNTFKNFEARHSCMMILDPQTCENRRRDKSDMRQRCSRHEIVPTKGRVCFHSSQNFL
jgi:hypothetical protein